ncbi:MAG TPA: RNA-guided pseudouridylation complex pseudouridine synthase subunit Cbf5 [Methanocorpusculum sp.]|nr:RNA-guided pseudouridylation complex pseudouridine synthase subunit Cbf5 [Methanocorpusculum sp.]
MDCNGILLIDKPRGPSSHQVAAWTGKMLQCKVGHTGTLDPMVSGVLVVMLGKSVKLAPLLLIHEKEYIVCMRLHSDVSRDKVETVINKFKGRIYQRPPRRSSVKRALRIRVIYQIKLIDMQDRLVLFHVKCETGTYMRSLCVHIGLLIGCGAQMIELRRIRSGEFCIEDTYTLHEIQDAVSNQDTEKLQSMILPPEKAITNMPKIVVRSNAADAVSNGAILAGVGITKFDPFSKNQIVAIIRKSGKLVAIARTLIDSKTFNLGDTGYVARSERVFS